MTNTAVRPPRARLRFLRYILPCQTLFVSASVGGVVKFTVPRLVSLVLQVGRVVEASTHHELSKRGGVYRGLYGNATT